MRELEHRVLQVERTGGCPAAGVTIEPTGDRVAGKGDDAAAKAINHRNQRVIHQIEVAGQLLGAPLGTQCTSEGFREGGKARDVGKEGCPVHPVRQPLP